MTSTNPRRGKIFLKGTLQGRLVKRMAAYWALYHVVLWHGMFFLSYLEYRAALVEGEPETPFIDLYATFAWKYRSLALCAVAACPIILWDLVRMTHRVVGPLVRLEGTLVRMAHGETVRQLKFRDGDYVDGLEAAFNLYLASLNRRQAAAALPAASAGGVPGTVTAPTSVRAIAAHEAESPEKTRTVDDYAPILRQLEDINKDLSSIHVAERKPTGGE